jgi:CubicO group peptidase (beta-lactamase class C family)
MRLISIVYIAITMIIASSTVYAEAQSPAKQGIDFAYLDSMIEQGHIPNYQVAVIHADGSVSQKTGHYIDGIVSVSAVNTESIISLFSLSKPFTNLLALKLIDIGVLQLSEPIEKYLPEFKTATTNEKGATDVTLIRPILVSDLLLHTAGFSQNTDLQGWGGIAENYREEKLFGIRCMADSKTESLTGSVQRLAKIPLSSQPGTRYSYSVATDVLGRVLEVASGENYQSLLNKYIAGPLALKTLAIKVAEPNLERVATLYEPMIKTYPVPGAYQRYQPFSKFEVDVKNIGVQPGCISPGSGLTASMEDVTKLAAFFLRRMTFEDGSAFFSEKISTLVFANQLGEELGKSPLRSSLAYARNDGLSIASLAIRPNKGGDVNNQADHDFYYWSGFSGSGFWIDRKTDTAGVFITQLYPSDRFMIPKLVAQTRAYLRQ